MKRGRKPVPVVMRELHGNPRKTALPVDVPEGVGSLWAPPDWFDDEQRAAWFYALDHAPPGLLTGTDLQMLAVWCCACVEYQRATLEVRRLGQVIKTRDGNAVQSPFVGVMNRQALLLMRCAGELGFSPAARTALGREDGPTDPRWLNTPGPRRDDLAAYLAGKPDRLDG